MDRMVQYSKDYAQITRYRGPRRAGGTVLLAALVGGTLVLALLVAGMMAVAPEGVAVQITLHDLLVFASGL